MSQTVRTIIGLCPPLNPPPLCPAPMVKWGHWPFQCGASEECPTQHTHPYSHTLSHTYSQRETCHQRQDHRTSVWTGIFEGLTLDSEHVNSGRLLGEVWREDEVWTVELIQYLVNICFTLFYPFSTTWIWRMNSLKRHCWKRRPLWCFRTSRSQGKCFNYLYVWKKIETCQLTLEK